MTTTTYTSFVKLVASVTCGLGLAALAPREGDAQVAPPSNFITPSKTIPLVPGQKLAGSDFERAQRPYIIQRLTEHAYWVEIGSLRQFDVLVMENMFGDILSDLMAGLVGGLGFAPAGNIGEDAAVFEAVHGSAPDIAEQGIANPTGLLLSACLLLEHVGQPDVGARIRAALDHVVRAGEVRTRDMGGQASTVEFSDALVRALG